MGKFGEKLGKFFGGLGMGLISPLASVITTGIGAISARRNTNKTIEANRKMAEYQYSRDLAMWNRQNEYNSPQAQMQRYAEAGLNPNLIYSQGNSGNASSMPNYQAPTAHYGYKPGIDPSAMISSYQDMEMRQAQTNNVRAQTESLQTKTANDKLRSGLITLMVKSGQLSYDKAVLLFGSDVEAGWLKPDEIRQRLKESGQRIEESKGRVKLQPYQASALKAQARKSETDVEKGFQEITNLQWDGLLKYLTAQEKEKNLQYMDEQQRAKHMENVFNEHRNELAKFGIFSSDNFMFRMLYMSILQSMGYLKPVDKPGKKE